jgi:hypothetical protein
MFAPWESSNRDLPALGPPVTSDFHKSKSFRPYGRKLSLPPLESHFVSPTFHDALPVQPTSPAIHHLYNVPSYEPTIDSAFPSMENGRISQEGQFLEQWESIDYGNTWDEEAIRYGFHHEQPLEDTSALSPTESFGTHHLENPRLPRRSESVTAISPRQLQATFPPATSEPNVLGEPFASAIGQPTLDMTPPPRKRSRKSSSAQSKAKQPYNQDRTRRGPEDLQDQQSTGSKASQAPSAGRFVHSICGKRFANRFKVKKHHWGNKINDVNTTTGCWYKNHKPNVDWDAHPSCKEAPRHAEEPTPTPVKPLQAKATSVENKAPTVPAMGVGPRNILSNAPARHLSQPIRSPHAPSSYMQGGYRPYHSHGLPPIASSSPFQNLLTVVNVAANIESPIPKGRNDSVIFSNLDAEAITVEHTPAWALTRADQASYLDPVFDQHQRRPSSPRPTTYNNAMEPEW